MKLKINFYLRIFLIILMLFSAYCILFNENKNLKKLGWLIMIIDNFVLIFIFEKQKREK
jgi:hypothetical protein